MRTYSHAVLTWALARRATGPGPAAWAALGATVPDLPLLAGASRLAARRLGRFSRADLDAEVCARDRFRRPDAALHSILPLVVALTVYGIAQRSIGTMDAALPAFLLGWAGHVAADVLTHGSDARPLLWPLSPRRFHSPISYRERERHALAFTVAEHAALLAALASARRHRSQTL